MKNLKIDHCIAFLIKFPKLTKFINKIIFQINSNECLCNLQSSRANQWTGYMRVYIQFEVRKSPLDVSSGRYNDLLYFLKRQGRGFSSDEVKKFQKKE